MGTIIITGNKWNEGGGLPPQQKNRRGGGGD